MKATMLFSGGKDSGLSTILLEPFFDEIELVTFTFGHDDSWKVAERAARELGHPHKRILFSEDVLENALKMLITSGYPNDALNYIHKEALTTLACDCKIVADGTRRDDRAPKLGRSAIKSLEDRMNMQYLRPLAGLGGKTIKAMASRCMDFEEMPSELYPASDFEVGLRFVLAERMGEKEVERVFPANHFHTRVIRRKRFVQEIEGQEDQTCQGVQSES